MNIFVLDPDPEKAAAMICDCHVRKMCLETAQILSACMVIRDIPLESDMPRPMSINHPVITVIDDARKLDWVLLYNVYLHNEYYKRFGKAHAYNVLCSEYNKDMWDNDVSPGSDDWSISACYGLYPCVGDMSTFGLDVVEAYRKYYTEVKKPTLIGKGLWTFTKSEDWTNG